MSAFDGSKLFNSKITITSIDHLISFLNNGYEISKITWRSTKEMWVVPTLFLEKENELILADALQIGDYVLQLKPLGEQKKRKNGFVWVSNTKEYYFLEQRFIQIMLGDHASPVRIVNFNVKHPEQIHKLLSKWVKNNAQEKYENTNMPKLFNSVHVIGTTRDTASLQSYYKDSFDLGSIESLFSDSSKYDNHFAVSFFLLAEKNPDPQHMLVGIIMYDLKTKTTACFNIQDVDLSLSQNKNVIEPIGRVALHLFNKSIDKNMECKSYLPLPVSTDWYTPLPWFTYLALQPIPLRCQVVPNHRNITVPEFLTFGYAEDHHTGNSFSLKPFSLETSGSATCVLKFKDRSTVLTYVLRFDQWSGKTLIHIDYSIYGEDRKEIKFIEHYPLDLETVYQFSADLFLAILSAGMYDARFSTIIEAGLKGVRELIARNAAYFYPFRFIFMLEETINWFDEKPERYQILTKVASGEQITSEERKIVDYMHDNFIGVIARENGREGTGFIGDAIRFRLERNHLHLRVGK